ncbi:recombinase family protein [Crassaminicella profunda]|uniref:recombinase family protein n=1 Tax=Crassaminicella profunda TaxID=1286698 RepID=UPI001CA6627C|nr:recombinase family protein [Crassaminicella profunda]QZY53895.1 recombinase family protein [Crassaminicella profunda]
MTTNSQQVIRKIDDYIRNKDTLDKDGHKKTLLDPTPEHYAAIYARISGKNDSFSLDSQKETCTKFIEENNLLLYKVYQDKESARIKHFYDRKEFKKLLSDMETGMFKNLVLIRRDRLSRRIDDFMHLRRIFKKHHVKVFYVKEGNLNFDSSSYITNFLENILMSISTLEPEYIYQRTKGGRQNLRYKGIFQCGNPPFGYSKVKGKKHDFEINTDEAELVKRIFATYKSSIIKDCNTLDALIESLNSNPIKKITKSFLKRILQRSIYGGKMIIEEDDSLDDCVIWDKDNGQYLLDEKKFMKCENFAKLVDWKDWKEVFLHFYFLEKGPLDQDYLFKNLLYCNTCKEPLMLKNGYYICKQQCMQVHIDNVIGIVFEQIIHEINAQYFQRIFQTKIKKINKKLTEEKKTLAQSRKNMRNKLDEYIITNDTSLKKEIASLQSDIQSTQENINEAGNEKLKLLNILNNLDAFKKQLGTFTPSDIQFFKENWQAYHYMLSKFIKKVVLKKSNGQNFSITITYKK